MDGQQVNPGQALETRLAVWMAVVIAGFALVAGAVALATSYQEANELQDDQLLQIAALAGHHRVSPTPMTDDPGALLADPASRVILQFLPVASATVPRAELAADRGRIELPANLPNGIQTVTVQDEAWRIFVKTLDSGERIAVGQQTSVRNEIARDSALRTLLPFLVLIPVLLVLVSVVIRHMLKPVRQLALALDQRDPNDLGEVPMAPVPIEIRPFVVAINRLLSRVAQAMAQQRRFLADAAHELRSPLTALSLQAERLGAAELSLVARERLHALQAGVQRSRQLLDQLLALARAQDSQPSAVEPLSVRRACHRVLEDLMPLAQARQIDLGLVGAHDFVVQGSAMDLQIVLRNLIDNALRYTPPGGKVDVLLECVDERNRLCVEDSGPGIDAHERERVFDPFYRISGTDASGSGLGLSIVKSIAERLGATVNLDDARASEPRGLRACMDWPAQTAVPTSAP